MVDYKHVTKLVINDKFGFAMAAMLIGTGVFVLIILLYMIRSNADVSDTMFITTGIVGFFNTINGWVQIEKTAFFKRKRVYLLDIEKLRGDYDD